MSTDMCRYMNTPEGCKPPDGKPCKFLHTIDTRDISELKQEILNLKKHMDEKDKEITYLRSLIFNKKQQEITIKQYDICIDYLLKRITEMSKNIRSAILHIPMTHEELEHDLERNGLIIL